MNIKELIADLQLHFPASDPKEIAKALLAQQAVIEKMRAAIGAWERAETPEEIQEAEASLITAINLQPDLSALREHDAEVCQEFANFLGIERREDVLKWIAGIREVV